MTITIPTPGRGCSPNTYKHWRTVSAAKKLSREAAHVAALSVKPLGYKPVPSIISVEWYMGKQIGVDAYTPLDHANAWAALKGAVDGLVDAGVLMGDSHTQLSLGSMTLHRTRKQHGGKCQVVITVDHL